MDEAREEPRLNFFSLTFLVAFGLGSFVGVALALLAIVLADPQSTKKETTTVFIGGSTDTPAPGSTSTPAVRPKTKSALEVRIGPGEAYAVIGQLGKGDNVEVVGRDSESKWAAIRFPQGSAARGWVPVSELDGLTSPSSLAIVVATPLPRSNATLPPGTRGFGQSEGDSGLEEDGGSSGQATRVPTSAFNTGPVDLRVVNVTVLSDGHIQIVIGNLGPGDLHDIDVAVSVRSLQTGGETFSIGARTVKAGATVTVRTPAYVVLNEGLYEIVVDPNFAVNDPDRNNNRQGLSLAPPAPPPTPTPIATAANF
ncbi:MAG TPA: SH3 domain-containing protein [Dehalococcoidia bacterium]|nr:SH3 domain-containing protein [Dehalococcoidia bacterium]